MLTGMPNISPSAISTSTASLTSVRKSPNENTIKEKTENQTDDLKGDEEEQLEVVKSDYHLARKRNLIDLDNKLLLNQKHHEAKFYEELNAFPKRIKFDTQTTNQSYDNQFYSHSNRTDANSSLTNNRRDLLDTNLCYS